MINLNYIGSKHSLSYFLKNIITTVAGGPDKSPVFADLFAGTGSVGSAFKQIGYDVYANDFQYYSYVLNRHLIGNSPLDTEIFEYLNSLEGVDGFIFNAFCPGGKDGRNYFTDYNGRKCDAIRIEAERLKNKGDITEDQYFFILASLINSIDKYANTASVYGAYLKHFKKTALKELILEPMQAPKGIKGKIYCEDANTLIKKIKGDILYIDPPYNTRQYYANYHVLETLALYDSPVLKGKTGQRTTGRQKSSYCSLRHGLPALEDMIAEADFKYIFLSYNNEGIIPLEKISEIMKKYGKYTVFITDHKRFRADKEEKRSHKADVTTEYLHCLVKN